MDADEYQGTLLTCYLLVQQIIRLPLEQMRRAQEHAEAVTPIVDPTLYRRKGRALREDGTVTRLLLEFKRQLLREFPDFFEQEDDDTGPVC